MHLQRDARARPLQLTVQLMRVALHLMSHHARFPVDVDRKMMRVGLDGLCRLVGARQARGDTQRQ